MMITLLLSLVSIYLGLKAWINGGVEEGTFYIGMGAVTLALSAYMLFQTRRRVLKLIGMEMQPLSTTLQCQKCGLKNVREFQKGDFIFKQTDQACPQDNEKMVISAIYREVKEKGKEES